jgi:hypothetical protein
MRTKKNLKIMLKINPGLAYLVLGISTTLLLAACSENKIVQCNKFAQVNEKVRVSLEKHSETAQAFGKKVPKDMAGFTELAEEMSKHLNRSAAGIETARQIIEGLNVQDEKLKSFKSDYIKITKSTGEATQELSRILAAQSHSTEVDLKNGKLKQLEQDSEAISRKIAASGEAEKKLMDNFNIYCGGMK